MGEKLRKQSVERVGKRLGKGKRLKDSKEAGVGKGRKERPLFLREREGFR